MLSLSQADDRVVGGLEYATALFERSTVKRYAEYLRMLLRGMAGDEHLAIRRIPVLPEVERKQVVHGWNRTAEDFPADRCVHELFEEQVTQAADRVAVVFEDSSLSYGELNRRANRLAHVLRGRGVGPESRVGVCMERSLEMLIALLGTMKAGAAYVPIDPTYPAGRLRLILEDSRPRVLLVNGTLSVPTETPVIDLSKVMDSSEEWSSNLSTGALGLTCEHLAYLIYTSGSTGLPKGVAVPHRGLCNLFTWMIRSFGLTSRDAVLHFAPFTFDASVRDFFWPLLTGARR